jgi:hypothetical protein
MRVASGAALSAASLSSFSPNKSRTWQNYGAGVMQAILPASGCGLKSAAGAIWIL